MFYLGLFGKNLDFPTYTEAEFLMDFRLDSETTWKGEEVYSKERMYFEFEEDDTYVFGYEQPLLVELLDFRVNPTEEEIIKTYCASIDYWETVLEACILECPVGQYFHVENSLSKEGECKDTCDLAIFTHDGFDKCIDVTVYINQEALSEMSVNPDEVIQFEAILSEDLNEADITYLWTKTAGDAAIDMGTVDCSASLLELPGSTLTEGTSYTFQVEFTFDSTAFSKTLPIIVNINEFELVIQPVSATINVGSAFILEGSAEGLGKNYKN
jgi:hypothetical protein